MISPETIARIRALMIEASVYEEDLEESFILGGGPGGQKTNKTSSVVRLAHEPSGLAVRLARRMLAEAILSRERGRKTAAQQEREKKRRQKRRRSRRQKQRMLADKRAHAEKKANRRPVDPD